MNNQVSVAAIRRIHFIGVSGSGVSAVAGIALAMGLEVTGSADERNSLTGALAGRGMTFYLGHRAGQVGDADAVVMSAAVPGDNPEVTEARRRGIPVYLYAQYLGMLMSAARGVAVAGTHGKTTTVAMITWLLDTGGLDPTAVCGGVMNNYGSNARFGRGGCLVAEACEYNRSFLSLKPRVSVVTNIEADHLDYYRDLGEIREAFGEFLRGTHPDGCAVVNGDDTGVRTVLRGARAAGLSMLTVGTGVGNRFRIGDVARDEGRYRFALKGEGEALDIRLPLPGRFNCVNAALAGVCALRLGVPGASIERGFASFRGTSRRLELLGTWRGGPVYTDYAHHPTEIAASVAALREVHPDRPLTAVFQPHQYSRTAILFDGLVEALSGADAAVITEVFRQRDAEEQARSVSGERLAAAVREKNPRALYAGDLSRVPAVLRQGDFGGSVILFMGAGDIDAAARGMISHAD